MKERALHFGPRGSLLGILTVPAAPRPAAPAVIFINSGLIHRVGPNRLYVTIARRLADLGFPSLRFDVSGIGDSVIPGGDMPASERVQRDIRLVMDVIEETLGCDHFVLMGLCFGAFSAHAAAVLDERVAGCIQLDGYVYPTLGYYLRHYGRRVAQIGPWVRFLKRVMKPKSEVQGSLEDETFFGAELPPKHVFARELAALVERETQLLFVFTGGEPQSVNYARQLHDCVPGIDLDRHATVRLFPEADHTFTFAAHRSQLVELVADWMDLRFQAGRASRERLTRDSFGRPSSGGGA